MKKKVTKRTQSSKIVQLPGTRELADENRDFRALLTMSLAAFYDMANTMNDFYPLVQKLEKTLKLEGMVPKYEEVQDDNTEL